MNREDVVIIFREAAGRNKCKLCACPSNWGSDEYFCRGNSFNIGCIGFYNSEEIQGKRFDNTKDRIILTENMCYLCDICNGMNNCRYHIMKYVTRYMEHVRENKVRHNYEQ